MKSCTTSVVYLHCTVLYCMNIIIIPALLFLFLCLPSFDCIVFNTTGKYTSGSDENIIVFWKSSVFYFFI